MSAVLPDDPVSPAEVARNLTRVADRLRVMAPRWAAREGAQAADDLARVRAHLQRLADLVADAESQLRREVPVLGAHALGDQVLVLGHDALEVAAVDGVLATTHEILTDLRALL